MLWLALHLPELSLDVFRRGRDPSAPEAPAAVVERRGGAEWLCAANGAAEALGVRAGLKRSAALALAGTLLCHPRRPAREAEALAGLAAWAQQFTPAVSLAPPAALLLEIGGSLAYFGGLDRLRARAKAGLAALGYGRATWACAPTPLAALWLAQAGRDAAITERDALEPALAGLPVEVLPLPAKAREQLRLLGARRLREVLALPSAGLARRFGPELPELLARALGGAADPRPAYEPPPEFRRRLELNWPAANTEPLLFLGRRLFAELAGFLAGRNRGVERVELVLRHEGRTATRLELGFGQPTRDAEHMHAVLRERLARHALAAPVEALALAAERMLPLDAQALDLFDDPAVAGDRERWLARLAARLGEGAVRGLACVPDHRPERAWRACGVNPPSTAKPGKSAAAGVPAKTSDPAALEPGPPAAGTRPGWLLDPPQPLPLKDERPWHGEPLVCIGRAERIESGWWDGAAVARDYYAAAGPSGRRYWLFQDRHSLKWFLQGVFA